MVHENRTMSQENHTDKPASEIVPVFSPTEGQEDNVQRIGGFDTLEPGTYWRATQDIHNGKYVQIHKGDVHLLMDVHLVLGEFHSVKLLEHPRDGGDGLLHIAIKDFWTSMEPCYEAQSIRQAEQAAVMKEVAGIQEEIILAGANPMESPEVRAAAEKALKELEDKLSQEALMAPESIKKRKDNLAKIHRRAARRSEAAGNPLAVRRVVISNSVSDMIGQKVTSDALAELQHESRRRAVIAEAASGYLTKRTEKMGETLKSLTPYYAEQAQVALAKSKGAISRAKDILTGLESLKLYTGDGCEVVEVVAGDPAPASEKLTLFQAKRYMDESLCLHADINMSFDWESRKDFFDELKDNPALRDLVLPAPRCVVSMAVTRRDIRYYDRKPREAVELMMKNQEVFLLVRNGQNVHVVYSGEPSHECTERLFPTTADLNKPFMGIDGSQLQLEDLKYVKSVEKFDEMALHYKRFLVLLCGLDHREKLFGEFYPEHEALRFMSLDFQSTYFDFVRDDDASVAIGDGLMPVQDWFKEKNKALRSGSRLVATLNLVADGSPGYKRRKYSVELDALKTHGGRAVCIARRDGEHHFIEITGRNTSYGRRGELCNFKCWLDNKESEVTASGWLCMDSVTPAEVARYLNSRNARAAGGIGNMLTLKMVRAVLLADAETQKDLRAYLRKSVLDNGVLGEEGLDDKILLAINTWRSANRGALAPTVDNTAMVTQILNLLYPKERLAPTLQSMVEAFCARVGRKPLRLVRTGKDKVVLYASSTPEEVATVHGAVHWGWVNRIALTVTGKAAQASVKESANRLVWPVVDKLPPDEVEICAWGEPGAAPSWLNAYPEPCPLAEVIEFLRQAKAIEGLGPLLREQHLALRNTGSRVSDRSVFNEATTALGNEVAMAVAECAAVAHSKDKYFAHTLAYLPVAVFQDEGANHLRFWYVAANSLQVIRLLADAVTCDEAIKLALHRFPGHHQSILDEVKGDGKFILLSEKTPIKPLAKATNADALSIVVKNRSGDAHPALGTLKTNEPGGLTKSRRNFYSYGTNREKSSTPMHAKTTAHISHSRAFERLMGVAPIERKAFFKSVNSRVQNIFGVGRDDIQEARKAERKKPFVAARYAGRWVSSLAWDATKNRAVANAHFPRDRLPKSEPEE